MRAPVRPRAPSLLALAAVAVVAGRAAGEPARDLRYAESSNRLVFAIVFGSRDTCRVVRRATAPRFERADLRRRRYGAGYRGEPGDDVIAEFPFGRHGRPVHMVPDNEGRFLLALSNRAPDGSPPRDRLHDLTGEEVSPVLDYAALPRFGRPSWPPHPRGLPRDKERPEPSPASYAFVSRQEGAGPVYVARRTEWKEGNGEIVCFRVSYPSGEVRLPSPDEAERLLGDDEPLMRAGAAWAFGRHGHRAAAADVRAALVKASGAGARATIAEALVRCGDDRGRRTLRALLADDDAAGLRAAANALGRLEPDASDADALAGALARADGDPRITLGLALHRLGAPGLRALIRESRSTDEAARAAAARVLGHFEDPAAEKRVLAMIRDRDDGVATAAVRALINPPRRLLPEHHPDFARALDAVRRKKLDRPSAWLCVLAAHAKIAHDDVLEALVDLAPRQDRAVWALRKLTGDRDLRTAEDCRKWWRHR